MSRRYVIEEANLQCPSGTTGCRLLPYYDRHVFVGNKKMGNMTDYSKLNQYGGEKFGTCVSEFTIDLSNPEARSAFKHKDQLLSIAKAQDNPCQPCSALIDLLQWQNVQDNVLIGKAPALMHDSWTICLGGLSIVTLSDSGQQGDAILTMEENLDELEAAVDQYMKDNNIDPSKKDELMESMLMWHGYEDEDMPWDIVSTEDTRKFCEYMEKNNPHLYGYFENGLYIDDGENGKIDLTYAIGIGKAYKDDSQNKMSLITPGLANDKGMLGGALVAIEQGSGKSGREMIDSIIEEYKSPNYDSSSKYKAFISQEDLARKNPGLETGMKNHGLDPENMSVREKNQYIQTSDLKNNMDSRDKNKPYYNPTAGMSYTPYDANKEPAERIMQQIYEGSEGGNSK